MLIRIFTLNDPFFGKSEDRFWLKFSVNNILSLRVFWGIWQQWNSFVHKVGLLLICGINQQQSWL
jgi:hypothetical protein